MTPYQQRSEVERRRREKRRALTLAVGVLALTVGLGTPRHPGVLLDGPLVPARVAAAALFSVLAGSVYYTVRQWRPNRHED